MVDDRTLELIIRLLEECLEHDYDAEELRSKAMDMLRLLNGGVHQYSPEFTSAKGVSTRSFDR